MKLILTLATSTVMALSLPAFAQESPGHETQGQPVPIFLNPAIPQPYGAWDSDKSDPKDGLVTGRSASEPALVPQAKPNNDADTQGVAH